MLKLNYRALYSLPVVAILSACDLKSPPIHPKVTAAVTEKPATPGIAPYVSDINPTKILERKQVPILCFHRIRAFKPTDTRSMKDYIVPVETFREEIKLLADSGYHTI